MGFAPRDSLLLCQRPELSDLLRKRVVAFSHGYRQNVALLGYPGVGKTSLIFEIVRSLPSREVIPIYMEIPTQGEARLVRSFVGTLLFEFFNTPRISPEDTLEILLDHAQKKLPRTHRACVNLLRAAEAQERGELWGQLLGVPQILHEEARVNVLLIFDEFHNLERLDFPRPFFELSNKIMVQKNIMHLLVSSAPFQAERILKEKLSLLFGNFEIIRVDPFDAATANRFITQRLSTVSIDRPMADFLFYITGGYPFYLSVLTEQLRNDCVRAHTERVSKSQLIQSIVAVLGSDHGVLNQHFTHRIFTLFPHNGDSNVRLTILLAIANGNSKTAQIAAALHKPSGDVSRILSRLIDGDIVRKKGVFHEVTDPLLAVWLRLVVQRRCNTFNMPRLSTAEAYESDLDTGYDRYLAEYQKPPGQRVKELFARFGNEVIELGNKRFVLCRFDSLAACKPNGVECLDAMRGNTRWRCYIEPQLVTESSVNKTLQNVKANPRGTRNVLLALAGIDENARLKALDAKIWIWDATMLNELLTIYHQPHVFL